MNLGIKNKIALVTGGGRGIGRAIALNLAAEGVKVAAISRTGSNLQTLLKEMEGPKKGHYAVSGDLTQRGMPEKAYEEIKNNFGIPDIIINNLGGLYIKDPFCPVEDWQKVWRMNMEVAIELNNLIIPEMKKKKWGRIVNIASIAGIEAPAPLSYSVVKASLIAYTRSMGRLLAPLGIIMTAVAPGVIKTKGGYWDKIQQADPQYIKEYIDGRIPTGRLGLPKEIAGMVTYLCSDLSSFCAGSVISVDGGQVRSYGY